MSLKLLILTSSTGGGHDMRAAALKAWAGASAGWDVVVHQALESTHPLYAFGVGLYNAVQRTLPLAHHAYFAVLEGARLHASSKGILGADRFLQVIEEQRPDLVVSTHAHLNHGFFDLVRMCRGRGNVRCATYCGELWGGYGFSRHWVNPDADGFIAAVEPCLEQALALGMPPAKTTTGGFLLRPEFFAAACRPTLRRELLGGELGLDPAAPTLLLATGAVGANNHLSLLHCLEARRKPVQVIALCGNRAGAVQQIDAWGAQADFVTVRALAHREDMPRLIRGVDLLIARPGTGTTSEAVLCGTPLVFNCIGGAMPQEYLTIKFARHHGLGRTIFWPADLARFLDEADRDPQLLDRMRTAAVRGRPGQHPRDILACLERIASS